MKMTPHFTEIIQKEISSGRYTNPIEVIEAGLDLLDRLHTHSESIATALHVGEESGPALPLDLDEFLLELKSDMTSKG